MPAPLTDRQSLLQALAPLVKSGLVDRDEALRVDAQWAKIGYDKKGAIVGGQFIPAKAVSMPKKSKEPEKPKEKYILKMDDIF